MVIVPACFMIIVTLVIRACLAMGGPQGVLTFLRPDWILLKEPTIWIEANSQVIFSLQLGLGAITASLDTTLSVTVR
jgi:SNF family Na+-dependent transporter